MATSMTQVCKEHDNGCDYGCPACNWNEGVKYERTQIAKMLQAAKAIENPDIMVKHNVLLDIMTSWVEGRAQFVKEH